MKKLLSLDDLYKFYFEKGKNCTFNAKEENSRIYVQVEETLNFSNDYDPNELKMPVHLKACHLFENRNHSSISEKAMKEAIPSFYNAPILGYIHKLEDGSYDFAGHEAFINEDGEYEYEEIPVGVIPESCNAQLVYDEEMDKTYLEVDGFIYRDYTRAADILEEKKECKVSVELAIDELSYSADKKVLNIEKFHFSGVSILGVDRETYQPIGEGMLGSNITLASFSAENNSIFSELEESKLIETLDRLNETLSNFNIQANAEDKTEEGGNNVNKFEELLNKYEKTLEDITFEYENLSDEELEAAFAQAFVEAESEPVENEEFESEEGEETFEVETAEETEEFEAEAEVEAETEVTVETVAESEEFEEETVVEAEEDFECGDKDKEDEEVKDENKCKTKCSATIGEKTYDFALSLNAKIEALSTLVNDIYSEADNTFYSIEAYDNYVVMVDYWTGRAYKQNYKCKKDTYSLTGDRIEVYAQFLTQDEINALDQMKGNYSAIETELNAYKAAEVYADKLTVFDDENYAQFLETEEFKALMSEETINALSKEELLDKAELTFAKLVKANGNFALKSEQEDKPEKKPDMFAFAKIGSNTSFLDGLLNK